MKTIEETKEKITYLAGYEPMILLDGKVLGTAWDELMNEINGDPNLINYYMAEVVLLFTKQTLDEVKQRIDGLDSLEPVSDCMEYIDDIKTQLK